MADQRPDTAKKFKLRIFMTQFCIQFTNSKLVTGLGHDEKQYFKITNIFFSSLQPF